MLRAAALAVFLLLLTLACRKPVPAPTFDQALLRAAAASEMALDDAHRPDYREGFLNGARMVEEAVKAGRKPFMPRMGKGPSPYQPAGPLPEGATIVQDEPLQVEVDAATGLQLREVHADFTAAFARGQVDGFQWALARHPADLIQPKAPPALPAIWDAWPAEGGALALSSQALNVDVVSMPGLLAWSIRERGFPPRRNWRPVPAWVQPTRAGLVGDAFWIDTEKGALGLDLDTGAIRRVETGLPKSVAEDGEAAWARYEKEWRAEADAARPKQLAAAAKGDAKAMLELAWGCEDSAEATSWFRRAAEAGDAQGMLEFGTRLYQGRGITENRGEAKAWFQKAAAAGHPSADEVLKGLFGAK